MSAELWYFVVNLMPLPWWGLMILAPRTGLTRRMTQNYAIFVVLAAMYVVFLGVGVSQLPAETGFGFGYEQVRGFLTQSPWGFIGGWIHYLVLDLFAGFWVYKEGLRLNIPIWQTSLCLLFVLLMGPLGLGLFLIRRHLTCHASRGAKPKNPPEIS